MEVKSRHLAEIVFCIVIVVLTCIIASLPSGRHYERRASEREARGEVVSTENNVFQRGIFKQGEQTVKARLLDGPEKGTVVEAANLLQGNLEMEWFYAKGQKGIVGYSVDDGKIVAARMLEPLRERVSLTMFLCFLVGLVAVAGWTGAKAILSFCFTVVTMWKVLLPLYLESRFDPVLVSLAIVAVLCGIIIFLVAGLNKRGLIAYLGSLGGCLATWVFMALFGGPMGVNGTTEGFATTLHFSGYTDLDLLRLFFAGAILSASGAIMDVAVDIATAMHEIKEKKPGIGRWELILSGNTIGRAVVGTMSVTLLLAYSGSALTMLMLMIAKGIPLWRILNMNMVSAEILKTLSGTLGVTLVAPLSALIGGFILVPLKSGVSRRIGVERRRA